MYNYYEEEETAPLAWLGDALYYSAMTALIVITLTLALALHRRSSFRRGTPWAWERRLAVPPVALVGVGLALIAVCLVPTGAHPAFHASAAIAAVAIAWRAAKRVVPSLRIATVPRALIPQPAGSWNGAVLNAKAIGVPRSIRQAGDVALGFVYAAGLNRLHAWVAASGVAAFAILGALSVLSIFTWAAAVLASTLMGLTAILRREDLEDEGFEFIGEDEVEFAGDELF